MAIDFGSRPANGYEGQQTEQRGIDMKWMIRRTVTCVVLLLASAVRGETAASAPADDWPRYAHDGALTSRSSLKGAIIKPHVSWQYNTAGQELVLEVDPVRGDSRMAIGEHSASAPAGTAPPGIPLPGPAMRDIDGSGTLRPAPEDHHQRWAKVLPDVKGLQRTAWSHTWTDQKICRLQLFAYDQGADHPRMVWRSDPPEDTIFMPLDVVNDIDGDGVQEICVAAHYRVMIYEGTTGRKETELRYHHSRAYGWFGIVDIDGDDRPELVTIGDFQSHIDVLNYDRTKPEAQRLSVRWRRDIGPNIDDRSKWPQVGPRPVVNAVGDPLHATGREASKSDEVASRVKGDPNDRHLEIALNMFNDIADGQWHVVVLDAGTGRTICDLPRRYLQGTADVDGDGLAELFTVGTRGVLVPTWGRIELVSARSGEPRTLWSADHAAWAAADLPTMGVTWSTGATQGMKHVLVTQEKQTNRPAAMWMQHTGTADTTPRTTLMSSRWSTGGTFDPIWTVSGLPDELEPIALAEPPDARGPAALVRLRLPTRASPVLTGRDAQVRTIERRPLGITLSTPIAARLKPGGPMTVVIEAPAGQILALEPPTAPGRAPTEVWQRSARGMTDGGRRLGLLAADLDGDGGCEIIAARPGPAGEAVLVAFRHDGSIYWESSFAEIAGGPPVWNLSALTYWWPGHFRRPHQLDLFVNVRTGPMHSDFGHLLDGRTGKIVWTQRKAIVRNEFQWGYAGIPPAVADLDGDGLDEIVSLYPVCFWIADGRTGEIKRGHDLANRKRLPAWAAYGEPMVWPFIATGGRQILLDSPYILALLDAAGEPIWHGAGRDDFPTTAGAGNAEDNTSIRQALADVDGDGTFEIASAGYGDSLRVMSAANGRLRWSLPAPTPTGSRVSAANIDGVGGDEILYSAGESLIAVTGDHSQGRVLWQWKAPSNLSMPAIADLDADGSAEIVIQSSDGTVFCLDSAP
ncbi:MAG: hypothetical protein HY718_20360 [Planctomycetes bacterium]|nr:hypothetical protein [Planctomycetota bacterium]